MTKKKTKMATSWFIVELRATITNGAKQIEDYHIEYLNSEQEAQNYAKRMLGHAKRKGAMSSVITRTTVYSTISLDEGDFVKDEMLNDYRL